MNDNIIKTLFYHNMMFDLNFSINPLLSLYASLSFLSLLFFFSLSLFQPPPLHRRNNHPTAANDKKISKGELLLTVSLLPSPSLTLSLCLSIFFLSLVLLLSFSFFHPPPTTPTSALYPPYASLSFLSPLFFFSLFLTLTYILINNFLSLFTKKLV